MRLAAVVLVLLLATTVPAHSKSQAAATTQAATTVVSLTKLSKHVTTKANSNSGPTMGPGKPLLPGRGDRLLLGEYPCTRQSQITEGYDSSYS